MPLFEVTRDGRRLMEDVTSTTFNDVEEPPAPHGLGTVSYVTNALGAPSIRADRLHESLLPTAAVRGILDGDVSIEALPNIDISIVTFRSAQHLPDFFASLIAQDYPLDKIALYVTRHCTEPEDARLLAEFEAGPGRRLREVSIGEQANLGFGQGHNRNLRRASSPYFVVANVDIEFYADTLVKLIQFAVTAVPDCVAVEARQFPFEHPKFYNPATYETAWVACCLVAFDREALAAVGGFDPVLFMYGEDVELSLRLRSRGYRLAFNPHALVHHKVDASRDREVMALGALEAYWLLMLSKRPYMALVLPIRSRMRSLSWYLRVKGRREGTRRLATIARHAVRRFLRDLVRGRKVVPAAHNGLDFEWRRPFVVDFDRLAAKRRSRSDRVKVSILMRVTAGRAESFEFALRSALGQTYPNIEVVIVEDGSQEIAPLARRYIMEGFPIRYISVARVGRSHACNLAMAAARGSHCVFLDDDDYFFLDHVETLVRDGIDTGASYSAAWSARVYADRRQGRIKDGRYQLPDWYDWEFTDAGMLQTNYFPIHTVLFSSRDALGAGRVNADLDFLEDWNFFGKLTHGRRGVITKRVTSAYRVPRRWLVSYRRGQDHLKDYERARKDMIRHIEARTGAGPSDCARQPGQSLPKARGGNGVDRGMTVRLLYHRIGAVPKDPFAMFVTPERFEAHLDIIANRIGKGVVAREGTDSTVPLRVEIHFDDAYADIGEAVRKCRERGLAVRVFATGYSFSDKRMLPGDEFLAHLDGNPLATVDAVRAALPKAVGVPDDGTEPDEWYRFFCDLWRDEPARAGAVLDRLRGSDTAPERTADVLMSAGELRTLRSEGCRIGSHGFVHTRLSGHTAEFVAEDTSRIAGLVADVDAEGATHFAFPYGSGADIDPTAVAAVVGSGCSTLYSTLGHTVRVGDTEILGRFPVGNLDAVNFAECLDRCIASLMSEGTLDRIPANHFLHDVVHVLDDTGW